MISIKRLKQVLNNKGLTMVELLVGLVVFAVIATSVLTILVSSLGTYFRARDYSEINGLMNDISVRIMDNLVSATAV